MKKSNKKFNKKRVIKELAEQFTHEFDTQLPVTILPDGSAVYKGYIIKQLANGNWGIYHGKNSDMIEEFFLKTCALLAAKAYNSVQMQNFHDIKQLDHRYWAQYSDNLIYKKNIKKANEFNHYLILLNKLEDSEKKSQHYKEEISRMFKSSMT
jgi:hypothetical protein